MARRTTPLLLLLQACALVAASTAPVGWAQEQSSAQREARRTELRREREALKAQQSRDEAACWKRFAVDNCLRQVRASVRARDTVLQREEFAIDDAERREKAAQRQQTIQAHERSKPGGATSPEGPARADPPTQEAGPARAEQEQTRGHAQPAAPRSDARERQRQAHERAAGLQRRQEAHAAGQQTRAREQASRAEEARQRLQDKQEKARQRRAEHDSQRAQEAAAGRPTPRPLAPPEPAH